MHYDCKRAQRRCSPASVAVKLFQDIFERGIVLTGGGSLLAGLDTLINKATGINVTVADRAQECVVLGAMKILKSMSNEKKNALMGK